VVEGGRETDNSTVPTKLVLHSTVDWLCNSDSHEYESKLLTVPYIPYLNLKTLR
jgi:hypothetical protein